MPLSDDKAPAAAVEKARRYDLVFFNEIETWDTDSNRYGAGSSQKRRAEFERMAQDGHFLSRIALRLAEIWPATLHHDPDAFEMLLKRAEAGDASAMCAVVAIPKRRELWGAQDSRAISRKYMIAAAEKGHPACMALYGTTLLRGNVPEIPQDRKAAMPMLLSAASEGYYVAARALFWERSGPALRKEFAFTNADELARALCWGRLAQQHSNRAGYDLFLGQLRDYARANGRQDLIEQSLRFDPRRVPITEQAVKPENCIPLERGG